MKSTLALIIPVKSGAHPDHELPKPQPPTGGAKPPSPGVPTHPIAGLPHPEHPIYYPLPPGAPVDPDYGIPIEHPDQGLPPGSPGTPTHPIQPPTAGKPPQPGTPTHPIAGAPGTPEHPIVLPPDAEGGWGPIYIWGGGPGARPPIALPPDLPAEGGGGKIEWETIWTPENGWQTIGVVVPGAPTPTPSKK